MPRGVFITIEGGEGAGKSTQVARLADNVRAMGRAVLTLHEPGGTAVGETIRKILLDTGNAGLSPTAELLLFEAARAQLVEKVIRPALECGEVVICDRFFDSTVAYQGFGRGLDMEAIEALNRIATCGCVPDRTVLIDFDIEKGLSRARRASGAGGDRLEREDDGFYRRVHDGFVQLAARDPERFRVVQQQPDHADTAAAVLDAVRDLLEEES